MLGLTVIWLLPCGTLISRLATGQPLAKPAKWLTFGLILLGSITLLSACFSPYPGHSFTRLWPTLSGIALFFWVYDWLISERSTQGQKINHLARGLATAGGALATVSLVGWFLVPQGINWSYRNDIPFGHSTYVAGAMILVLPWLALATFQTRGLNRIIWAFFAGVAGFVLAVTGSRGGVLAAGAMTAVGVGHFIVSASWTRRSKALLVALTTAVLILGVVSNPRLRDLVQGRGWSDVARESNAQRSAMLAAGLKLGSARPFTGWGPGTVPLTYPQVRGQLSGGVDNVLQLHNTPAQIWATLGIGGLAAMIAILAAMIARVRDLARQTTQNPAISTAACSLLGYGLFSLTDHQLDLPVMNSLSVLSLAVLFAGGQSQGAFLSNRFSRVFLFAASTLVVALLVPTGRDLSARFTYELALTAFEQDHLDEGRRLLETSSAIAPYDPYYRHQLVGRLLAKRQQVTDAKTISRLTEDSINQLILSLNAGCFQEFAHFNLGWLALEQNRPAQAANYFQLTAREAPNRRGVYWGWGLALHRLGNDKEAVRVWAMEWINDPIACADPRWEESGFVDLRLQVARAADGLLASLTNVPKAGYVRELWHWWITGRDRPTHGFDQASNELLQSLKDQIAQGERTWEPFLNAWRQLASSPVDAPLAAAITRRAQRHPPPDLHGFLTAGTEGETVFYTRERSSRLGYGILALHPDGFMLSDLYVRDQNRFITAHLTSLFPPKGWLPAPLLLMMLDDPLPKE